MWLVRRVELYATVSSVDRQLSNYLNSSNYLNIWRLM